MSPTVMDSCFWFFMVCDVESSVFQRVGLFVTAEQMSLTWGCKLNLYTLDWGVQIARSFKTANFNVHYKPVDNRMCWDTFGSTTLRHCVIVRNINLIPPLTPWGVQPTCSQSQKVLTFCLQYFCTRTTLHVLAGVIIYMRVHKFPR